VVLVSDVQGDTVRIQSGLAGNESVVLDHQADLFDGAPVEPRRLTAGL